MSEKSSWSIDDATSLYGVARWGEDYFHISDTGHLMVSPDRDASRAIDLDALVTSLEKRGVRPPVLVRFNGILKDRLRQLHDCFDQAISGYGYKNRYRCVFPIKVNQQAEVVRQVIKHGKALGFGVEAGSKAELIAVVAMADDQTPIICNGFKDKDYIRLALMAQSLGKDRGDRRGEGE